MRKTTLPPTPTILRRARIGLTRSSGRVNLLFATVTSAMAIGGWLLDRRVDAHFPPP